VGESYILSGDPRTLEEAIAVAARLGGQRKPRLHLPTQLLRLAAPVSDRLGGLPGMPANVHEVISASDGVTYWASHARATRELNFEPRSLEQGIVDTWGDRSAGKRGGTTSVKSPGKAPADAAPKS